VEGDEAVEEVEGEGAAAQEGGVEPPQVKRVAEPSLRFASKRMERELPHLVCARLPRPRNVTVDLLS
jgi:hypothetical protein